MPYWPPMSFFPRSVTSKSKDNDNEIVEKSKKVGLDLLLRDTPSFYKEKEKYATRQDGL